MADLINVTIHARDPRRLASFWSAALGYPIVTESDDLVRLRGAAGAGAPDLLFLRPEEPLTATARVHLDLGADDLDREVERLLDLGAALADGRTESGAPHRRRAGDIEWVVLTDPEGNELCIGNEP